MQMVREDRLPHALMLCGPVGSGKLALAIAFGCQLLDNGSPSAKAMLDKLEHPDLHFTYPTIKLPSMSTDHKPVSDDFAQEWHELLMQGPYFTMEEWMQAMGGENQQAIITAGESDNMVRKLSLKSSQGGYKVSIVWLPERMNSECANKLLKLIEEPPQQTVFIMVCEEPEIYHAQTAGTVYSPFLSGELRAPASAAAVAKDHLEAVDIVCRRAVYELFPGAIVNIGKGIGDGVGVAAAVEGFSDKVTFTLELGSFGGTPQSRAVSFSSTPKLATTSLLDVTTLLPAFMLQERIYCSDWCCFC